MERFLLGVMLTIPQQHQTPYQARKRSRSLDRMLTPHLRVMKSKLAFGISIGHLNSPDIMPSK